MELSVQDGYVEHKHIDFDMCHSLCLDYSSFLVFSQHSTCTKRLKSLHTTYGCSSKIKIQQDSILRILAI
jgi:hypothetical protein